MTLLRPGSASASSRLARPAALLASLVCLTLASCGDNRDTPVAPGSPEPAPNRAATAELTLDPALQEAVAEVIDSYLTQIERDFQALDTRVAALHTAVRELLAEPTETSLGSARQAWSLAHSAYQATLLHQHFANQVLPEEVTLRLSALTYQLDHWPILPGYVDSVPNYPDSGLVHDVNVVIDEATLRQVHGQFDLAEAALGFHVLEFLLWGDDPDASTGRDPADFQPELADEEEMLELGLSESQLPANRRRALVGLVSEVLLSDIQASRELTVQGLSVYGQQQTDLSPARALDQLLTALGTLLNEEFLVRSLYPLLNGDYEGSIQSPYSDATDNAVVAQLASIERLLLETRSSAGRSLDGILSQLSPEFAELFYQNFDASKECLVSLYSELEEPTNEQATAQAEFSIVECINLLTNMIDHFQQVQTRLQVPPLP